MTAAAGPAPRTAGSLGTGPSTSPSASPSASLTLPGTPPAAGRARHFVATRLPRLLADVSAAGAPAASAPDVDDVVLVVSELVTNAVRASADLVEVSLRVGDDHVELCVTDDAGGWPAPRRPERGEPGGRGLRIVDALTDGWRVTRLAAGKRVTATWRR